MKEFLCLVGLVSEARSHCVAQTGLDLGLLNAEITDVHKAEITH